MNHRDLWGITVCAAALVAPACTDAPDSPAAEMGADASADMQDAGLWPHITQDCTSDSDCIGIDSRIDFRYCVVFDADAGGYVYLEGPPGDRNTTCAECRDDGDCDDTQWCSTLHCRGDSRTEADAGDAGVDGSSDM